MVIKTASPGVIVNEVDLTRGTSDGITTNVGGMVGPFARGPVDELVLIETEAELQRVFGDPTTENCEYWYTVSNFLEYGGVCYVIRCDDASGGNQQMKNAVSNGSPVFIKNKDDFEENFDDGKGHNLILNKPLAVCDKTAMALKNLNREDIHISDSTYFYDGGGCC